MKPEEIKIGQIVRENGKSEDLKIFQFPCNDIHHDEKDQWVDCTVLSVNTPQRFKIEDLYLVEDVD